MIKKFLLVFFIFTTSWSFSQEKSTRKDSAQIDSLTKVLEKIASEWKPESEPWNFISFEIKNLDLKINYGQQSIHPFLAEYNRKIQFLTKNEKTDTLNMLINFGGRTLIEIYYDKNKNLLVMEDSFGRYFFDLVTKEYFEKPEDFEPYRNKEYIGRINGKEYPLKFEPKE